MEHNKISKNALLKNYNLLDVYDTKDVLINNKPILKGDLVAVMARKPSTPETMPAWFKVWNEQVFSPFKQDMSTFKQDMNTFKQEMSTFKQDVTQRLDKLEDKLNNVIKLNNLKS